MSIILEGLMGLSVFIVFSKLICHMLPVADYEKFYKLIVEMIVLKNLIAIIFFWK